MMGQTLFGPAGWLFRGLAALLALWIWVGAGQAADRDRLRAFLEVTGFDVALQSIRQSAASAPQMLGADPGDFGVQWTQLADEVFDTALMQDMALDILEETLSDALLSHGAAFYASDLGQRLVAAENAAHLAQEDEAREQAGRARVAEMAAREDPRLDLFERMSQAIDSEGIAVRAIQEIQLRFLLAASAAGVAQLRVDPDELRAMLKAQEGALRQMVKDSALAGAAMTYEDFSVADLESYARALEAPQMQQIYELMNAVQYEITANRFEALALRMAQLSPERDI